MFKIYSHVRYSEVDNEGNMTVDSIVNYLQDAVMLHSDTLKLGVRYLDQLSGYWFLSSWQIEVIRTPKVFENIEIMTEPYEFKGAMGNRYFEMKTTDGEVLVKANSTWVYLDAKTGMPHKVDEAQTRTYMSDKPILPDMECMHRKIKLPEELAAYNPIPVRLSQIDTNQHVNNCEYIRTFLEASEVTRIPKRIRAEYKSQARMGDVFYPYIYKDEKCCTGDLRDENGKSFAAVEFVF